MSQLKQRLQNDLKIAMKARDTNALGAIRFLLAQINNEQIDAGELSDEQIFMIIKQQLKQFDEAISGFARGGRNELVAEEQAKKAVVLSYLPPQASDDEIRSAIAAARVESGETHPGKLTGLVMRRLGPIADGSRVSQLIQAALKK
ncbi:MAG: GatB/YqeY domain-containing protein [Candidatus Pacebacteria bacterium]|nr:GatB/YqeY domain-containing protein [Candidatus Paceibacterota bacterium]PIR60370.1 MAG: glutamyl-tRNA amidotransferase [Candidatus Pacebacteria bacterium CG10_big_fil_rev_8_21_14_0_10_44_54]